MRPTILLTQHRHPYDPVLIPVEWHTHNLPLVFNGTSFLTSLHQFSFLWCSSVIWVDWSIKAFWRISRNWGQNWHILNISTVYLCIVLKWWIIPLVGLTRSPGVLSLIFTAFSILLRYKVWGRTCWPAIFREETWRRRRRKKTILLVSLNVLHRDSCWYRDLDCKFFSAYILFATLSVHHTVHNEPYIEWYKIHTQQSLSITRI